MSAARIHVRAPIDKQLDYVRRNEVRPRGVHQRSAPERVVSIDVRSVIQQHSDCADISEYGYIRKCSAIRVAVDLARKEKLDAFRTTHADRDRQRLLSFTLQDCPMLEEQGHRFGIGCRNRLHQRRRFGFRMRIRVGICPAFEQQLRNWCSAQLSGGKSLMAFSTRRNAH